MLVIVVTLWTTAAILILANPRNTINRWGSAMAFFTGFAPFCTVVNKQLLPYLEENWIKDTIRELNGFLLSFPYHIAPYTFLMFSLCFTGFLQRHKIISRFLPYILLIPVFYMYITTPITPKYKPDPLISTMWIGPYLIIGNIMLLAKYFKENNKKLKKHIFFTIAVVAPPSLYALLTNYFLRIFHISHLWKYSVIPGVITFVIFIIGLVKFGVMGVRLKPEQYILEGTMKAFSSGMAILSHTLKNEINKISICMSNIKQSMEMTEPDINDVNENVSVVMDSVDYLSKVIVRLRKQIEEIALIEAEKDLFEMAETAVGRVSPYIKQEELSVSILFSRGIKMKCDHLHIIEVITNILKNSIEAMEKGGILKISVHENKKHIYLSVCDNGKGIPTEDMDRIFEPFYSTKGRDTNFGLGLSYCYSVMKKHNGDLKIYSTQGLGTTVLLAFPKSRILSCPKDIPKRSSLNGQDQSNYC